LTNVVAPMLVERLGADLLVRPDGVIAAMGAEAITAWFGQLSG